MPHALILGTFYLILEQNCSSCDKEDKDDVWVGSQQYLLYTTLGSFVLREMWQEVDILAIYFSYILQCVNILSW